MYSPWSKERDPIFRAKFDKCAMASHIESNKFITILTESTRSDDCINRVQEGTFNRQYALKLKCFCTAVSLSLS